VLLVVHVQNIADRKAAPDQLDGPGAAFAVDPEEAYEVGRKAVRLAIDLGHETIPIVLHQVEQFGDFIENERLELCLPLEMVS